MSIGQLRSALLLLGLLVLSACGTQPAANPGAPTSVPTTVPAVAPTNAPAATPTVIPTSAPTVTPDPSAATSAAATVIAELFPATATPVLTDPGWIMVGRVEDTPGTVFEFGKVELENCPADLSSTACTEAAYQAMRDFFGGATWRFYETPDNEFDPMPHTLVITPGSAAMQALFGEMTGKYGYIDPLDEGTQALVMVALDDRNPTTGAAIELETEVDFTRATLMLGRVWLTIPDGDSTLRLYTGGAQQIESVSGPLAAERLGGE